MEIIQNMISVIDLRFIVMVFFGSFAGLFVGSLPGLSVSMATALLVSITYGWPVTDSLAVIMGVYMVGVYSGAVSAILIRIPGAPSSIATTLDGYPMSQKGRAYEALMLATVYSFIGGLFGMLLLAFTAKPIASFALAFQQIDYFLLAVLGMTCVVSLSGKNLMRGFTSAILGVLLALVGTDSMNGMLKFTFNIFELGGGVPIVPAIIGLFGFAEILDQIKTRSYAPIAGEFVRQKTNPLRHMIKRPFLVIRSAVIGALIGVLPGAGGPIAALISYDTAKRTIKDPEVPFGEGSPEGIIASETANNAVVGGALIPLLTLAVPGDSVTAIMLAVFYLNGMNPGPLLMTKQPEVFGTVVSGGLIACFAVLLLGIVFAPLLAKVIRVKKSRLMAVVALLCFIGAYATESNMFHVWIMIVVGLLAVVLKEFNYPVAPVVLGMVLGSLMDTSLRRAVAVASVKENVLFALFNRPLTLILLAAIIFMILLSIPAVKELPRKLVKRFSK